jgi:hypothetical protein
VLHSLDCDVGVIMMAKSEASRFWLSGFDGEALE